jgi:hypothetical protein
VRWGIRNGTGITPISTTVVRFNPDDTMTTYNPATTSYADDHVVGKTYFYGAYHNISAVDYTNFGNVARMVVQPGANANDPTSLRITGTTNGRTAFGWNLNAAVGSVSFDYRTKGAASWTTVPLASGTNTYALNNLSAQVECEARVRVSDAGTNPTSTVTFYGNGVQPGQHFG